MLSSGTSLVDSHCHLDFPDFNDDLPEVVDRAITHGVTRMVTIATSLSAEPVARTLADTYTPVFFAVGTHPHRVAQAPMATVDELLQVAQHPKMVAIGESGLDYHYTRDLAALQETSLRIHAEAARRSGLPLIIHARDADTDMARILADEHCKGTFDCVMHCFSSSAELADAAIELGFYLSMSGIVTFRNSGPLRSIFARVPSDRILVETDAPYLAPVPYRGKRNEPARTVHTAAVGAQLHGMSLDEFAALTTRNFDRLFAKANTRSIAA
ncbi:MAG: TatD family hydrolase [Paracoccaceae bacterium]|nr:TatD family hydrolase [Paracoccaceae bacterium]